MGIDAPKAVHRLNQFLEWLIDEGLELIFGVIGVVRDKTPSGVGTTARATSTSGDVPGESSHNSARTKNVSAMPHGGMRETDQVDGPDSPLPDEPGAHQQINKETAGRGSVRLTKGVRQQLLVQNEGVVKETHFKQRNSTEDRIYTITHGGVHIRATGNTSWSDSRYDKEWVANEEETHRFLRKYLGDLNTDGIE